MLGWGSAYRHVLPEYCLRCCAVLSVCIVAQIASEAAHAGAREHRAACWSSYSLCVIGAAREERWRTVCYSDYSACMKNPGEISCTSDDEARCTSAHNECTARGDGSEVVTYHCTQDQQVCLDSFGC